MRKFLFAVLVASTAATQANAAPPDQQDQQAKGAKAFILLNLALSFQAAYAAPFIMMSQNRQQEVDRMKAAADYQVNIKAELEIELLHEKIDELRTKEVLALTQSVRSLTAALENAKM